jgi:dienelactone hydrolase
MTRLTASDFHPEVLKLFDRYVHGLITRRAFLDAANKYAVGGAGAAGLLAALSPRFAEAQQVSPGDPRIKTRSIEAASPQGYGKVRGVLAQPAQAAGPLWIKAALLLHYAGNDQEITAGWPAYEAALKAGVSYRAYIYPGVEHGFNNDTTPRYDAAAAKLAWQRTIAFLNEKLRR